MYLTRVSNNTHLQIPCYNDILEIRRIGNQTILIDNGCLGKRGSIPSWIEYTLLPELACSLRTPPTPPYANIGSSVWFDG